MANPATVKKMAADEFLEWEQGQPGKHEFIAGEIFSMVGSTRQHATVAGNVFAALFAYSTPFGHAFHADSATDSRGIRPGGRSEATLVFGGY